jgi:glycosyltransferase involved in cell wall biosynthesis
MNMLSRRPNRPDFAIILGELSGVTKLNGGVGHRYKILIDYFLSENANFKVLVFGDKGHPFDAHEYLFVETWSRSAPWPIRSIYRALFARAWIKTVSPRVVLAPDWEGLCSFAPKGVPLVTNLVTNLELIHEISGVGQSRNWVRFFGYRLQKYLEVRQTKNSTVLIGISQAIKTWTEMKYQGIAPIRVVPNFLVSEEYPVQILESEDHLRISNSPFLLFVGRLEIRKGILETFEAFAKLHNEFPHLNLYLAGSEGDTSKEPGRAELLSLLPHGTASRIKFLGNLSKIQLFSTMQDAVIVLTPSRWEGFGNSTAEAMAVGSAVIATTGSGFSDFCVDGFNSLLVRPGDSEDLANGIRVLMMETELRSNIKSNARLVSHTLSVNILGPQYLEIIESQFEVETDSKAQK